MSEPVDSGTISRIIQARTGDELSALFAISNRLRRFHDLDSILREIINLTQQLLCAEACTLGLIDRLTEEIHFHLVTGEKADKLVRRIVKPGQGIIGTCVVEQRTLNVPDVSRDDRFEASFDNETDFRTKSILCVPLIHQGRCLGAIEVINKTIGVTSFSDSDAKLLAILGDQAAAAIEFGRIQEKLMDKHRLAVIGSMTASIIHDVRNPLAVIQGFADLIHQLYPDAQEMSTSIIRQCGRVEAMLQEILDFTRGTNHLNIDLTDLASFMKEICDNARVLTNNTAISLEDSACPDGTMEVDRQRLQRTILNLVSNSISAMSDGGTLTIEAQRDDRLVTFIVADTGCGMDDETQRQMFQPLFSRGNTKGVGLGMSIVKNIVDAHGGAIEVTSEVDVGTTIRIVIPARHEHVDG